MNKISLQHHLKQLEEKHHELDKRIDGMENTGKFEDGYLQELKKIRLIYKDEIVRTQKLMNESLQGEKI